MAFIDGFRVLRSTDEIDGVPTLPIHDSGRKLLLRLAPPYTLALPLDATVPDSMGQSRAYRFASDRLVSTWTENRRAGARGRRRREIIERGGLSSHRRRRVVLAQGSDERAI
jgi:hypothetical protein